MAKVPKSFQGALWSYDVSKQYPREKIIEVLSHPQRGVWIREVLRKLLNKEDLTIDPLEYEAAIINFSMPNSITEEVWKRKFNSTKVKTNNPRRN